MSWLSKIIHYKLGWHRRVVLISFDGVSAHGQCLTCGYIGMFDSQGNLF